MPGGRLSPLRSSHKFEQAFCDTLDMAEDYKRAVGRNSQNMQRRSKSPLNQSINGYAVRAEPVNRTGHSGSKGIHGLKNSHYQNRQARGQHRGDDRMRHSYAGGSTMGGQGHLKCYFEELSSVLRCKLASFMLTVAEEEQNIEK